MDGVYMNTFLLNVLAILPGLLLSLYLAVYLTLHFSFYRHIDRSIEAIRNKIISKWSQDFSDIGAIIDGVEIKYIRVLARPTTKSNKAFRIIQFSFCAISIILIVLAIYLKQMLEASNGSQTGEISYWILSSIVVYSISLTVISVMSFYEWSYYNLLDELEKNA